MVERLCVQFERLELEPSMHPMLSYARRRSPKIKTIGPGRLEIPDVGAGTDFKLYPGGGRFWDWSETRTKLETGIQITDVEELLQHGATTIVISRGLKNELQVDAATLRYLSENDITVHIANTWEAVQIYCKHMDTIPIGALFIFYPGQKVQSCFSRYVEEHDL